MSDLAWWQALASGAAGGVFALGGQWIKAHLDRGLARESRQADRAESRADRRDAFELEQLERARVLLPQFMSAVADYRQIEPDSNEDHDLAWAYHRSPTALAYFEAKGALSDLAAVLLDDEVRTAVRSILDDATNYIGAEGWTNHMDYWRRGLAASALLGDRIRELYGPECEA